MDISSHKSSKWKDQRKGWDTTRTDHLWLGQLATSLCHTGFHILVRKPLARSKLSKKALTSLGFVSSSAVCKTTHHDLQGRHGDCWQDVDRICWEIPSLLGPFIEPISPPRVHHVFSCVLVKNYEVSFQEAEEPRFFSHCNKNNH